MFTCEKAKACELAKYSAPALHNTRVLDTTFILVGGITLRARAISDERITEEGHNLYIDNADGGRTLKSKFIVCPNPECRHFTLTVLLYKGEFSEKYKQWIVGAPL